MSQPLLERAAKRQITRGQKVALAIACTVPLLLTVVAIPAFMSGDAAQSAHPTSKPAVAKMPTAPIEVTEALPEDEPETSLAIVTSADGDLSIALSLSAKQFGAGEPIVARVRVTNHGLTGLHLPAAGEPNATLAVILLDHEGMEVRRVIERGSDPLPLRTVRIDSGASVGLPVSVIAQGEEPLPSGTYSAQVEFDADPAWKRLGLPVWTAPQGTIRSYPVFFTISAE
jgi:hypothetical protein